MPETKDAFQQFVAPENAWMHEAIGLFEEIFGALEAKLDTDEDNHLVVTVVPDPAIA